MENEKEILNPENKTEQSTTVLKEKVQADIMVNYLARHPTLTDGEAEWKNRYATRLNQILDLHLKHSDPDYWKNDIPIYQAMIQILEKELYQEKEEGEKKAL